MSSANDIQVGGTHYRAGYQHWDLVADLKLDYFEAQVTKYVTRHAKKNGRQDLEKAVHYAQKAKELVEAARLEPRHLFPSPVVITQYADLNQLGESETRCILLACTWAGARDLGWLIIALKDLLQTRYPDA